jgi:hypothetical protein
MLHYNLFEGYAVMGQRPHILFEQFLESASRAEGGISQRGYCEMGIKRNVYPVMFSSYVMDDFLLSIDEKQVVSEHRDGKVKVYFHWNSIGCKVDMDGILVPYDQNKYLFIPDTIEFNGRHNSKWVFDHSTLVWQEIRNP